MPIRIEATLSSLTLALTLVTSGCGHHEKVPPPTAHDHAPGPGSGLERVAAIHGTAGPFAVAGYRMGERALAELGAPRGSFDLEVVHETPPAVQWSCIADGLQAATGTSAGKLNLKVIEVSADHTSSVVRNRKTGQALRFELAPAFLARWKDLPRERLAQAGGEVMALKDDEIFTVTRVQEGSR
jgi:formylmethanofuran dehydrogenase subunit E